MGVTAKRDSISMVCQPIGITRLGVVPKNFPAFSSEDRMVYFWGIISITLWMPNHENLFSQVWLSMDSLSDHSYTRFGPNLPRSYLISKLLTTNRFLLVKLHTDYLCQQLTTRSILTILENLKTTTAITSLDHTYDRVMATIYKQSEECADLAVKIFTWITKARRILKVNEIQTAVSVKQGRYGLLFLTVYIQHSAVTPSFTL